MTRLVLVNKTSSSPVVHSANYIQSETYLVCLAENAASFRMSEDNPRSSDVFDHRWTIQHRNKTSHIHLHVSAGDVGIRNVTARQTGFKQNPGPDLVYAGPCSKKMWGPLLNIRILPD